MVCRAIGPQDREIRQFELLWNLIIMKNLRYWPAIILTVILAVVAWIMLYVQNSDVLYCFQDGQLFIPGKDFFRQQMIVPGGPFTWAGLYLQQYLYKPALGTLMMIAIWLISFWALVISFNLKGAKSAIACIPFAGLMASVVNTGYWIFILKAPEYAVTPSLFFMTVSLLMLPGRFLKKPFGTAWQSVVTLIFIVLGLHWLKTAQVPYGLRFPFYLTLFSTILLLPSELLDRIKFQSKWYISAGSVILASAFVFLFCWFKAYKDDAYKAELKMTRLIEDARWDDVIKVAHSMSGKATREIWMFRNIALLNKGTMGSDLYKDSPMTVLPKSHAGVAVHMVESAGPLIYFMNGQTRYAYRWCMENSVEFGPSVGRLKIMVMCAIIHGEKSLAEKYLNLLSKTKYYATWAQEQTKYLEDSKLIEMNPTYRLSSRIYRNSDNKVDSDDGQCERYLMQTLSTRTGVTDPELSELCLMYSMQTCDIPAFWQNLLTYAMLHAGKPLPIHYQEAVVIYRNLAPQSVPENLDMSALNIDESVQKNFEKMVQASIPLINKGIDLNTVADQTYKKFGRTYFWYNMFCSAYDIY